MNFSSLDYGPTSEILSTGRSRGAARQAGFDAPFLSTIFSAPSSDGSQSYVARTVRNFGRPYTVYASHYIMLHRFGSDFRYVAPFGNRSLSRRKLRLNFAQFGLPHIKNWGGMGEVSASYLEQSSALPTHVLDLQYVAEFRNQRASKTTWVEIKAKFGTFLIHPMKMRGWRNV